MPDAPPTIVNFPGGNTPASSIGSAVELWLVDLEKCTAPLESIQTVAQLLSADDYERAQRIRDPGERRQRLATYVAVRVLLERIAGPVARGRPFARSVDGKPRLDLERVEFSLAHIDGAALIGVSEVALGVDLERMRPVRLTSRRLAEISAAGAGLSDEPLPDSTLEHAFLQAWARLEAFAKVRGGGLAKTLADVGLRGDGRLRLSLSELETRARVLLQEAQAAVHDLAMPHGLQGAVGVQAGGHLTQVRAFPAGEAEIMQLLA